jgi:hypothetical protein
MSNWVNHTKEYASRKGISYREALKDPECKSTYHNKKTEQKDVEKGNKIFKQKQQTKNLLEFGSETIEIPKTMSLDGKVVQAVTKAKTIARRNKQSAVNIEPTDDNKLKVIESNNKTPLEEHNEFKTELKTRTRARKTLKQLQGI